MARKLHISNLDPDLNFFNSINNSCKMFFPENLNNLNKEIINTSILHMNCRSIYNKLNEFNAFLSSINLEPSFSVIGLTETWLNEITAPLISFSDYNFVYKNRPNKIGEGVGLLINKNLDFRICDEFPYDDDLCDILSIEIINQNCKNTIISVIYRPPNININPFLDFIDDFISKASTNKIMYLLGDFNINLLNNDCHNININFINRLSTHNFFPLVHLPTRITETSATLIDNIFCNHLVPHNSGVIYNDISDHYPIFTTFSHFHNLAPNLVDNYIHNFSCKNLTNLNLYLNQIDWHDVSNATDVDAGFHNFISTVQNAIDQYCPLKNVIKMKKNKLAWMSSGLLISSHRKNKLYKTFIKNPTTLNKSIYLKYKNLFTRLMRSAEKLYFLKQFTLNKSNIKKTWDLIRISLNKLNSSKNITLIDDNGDLCTDKEMICTKFNEFFSSTPSINNNHTTDMNYTSYLSPGVSNSFFLMKPMNLKS